MYYQNFDDNITAKFGVVVENWPLKKFCNPSEVGSRYELKTLFHAWQSGATRFRQLSDVELEEWEEQRFQSKLHTTEQNGDKDVDENSEPAPNTTPQSPADVTTAVATTSSTTKRGKKRKGNDPFSEVANTVMSTDGTPVPVTKKARKRRSDAGVPRKAKAATGGRAPRADHTEHSTVGSATPPSQTINASTATSTGITPVTRPKNTTAVPTTLVSTETPTDTLTVTPTTVQAISTTMPTAIATAVTTSAPAFAPTMPTAVAPAITPVAMPAFPNAMNLPIVPAATDFLNPNGFTHGAPTGPVMVGSGGYDFPDFRFDGINFEELDADLFNIPQVNWGAGIPDPFGGNL
jgi:hypothetical protein